METIVDLRVRYAVRLYQGDWWESKATSVVTASFDVTNRATSKSMLSAPIHPFLTWSCELIGVQHISLIYFSQNICLTVREFVEGVDEATGKPRNGII